MKAAFYLAMMLTIMAFPAPAQERRERSIEPDKAGVVLKETIKGYESIDYRFQAIKGQRIVARLTSNNRSAYFNISRTGAQEALFIGSRDGALYDGRIEESADYTLSVYLVRAAARRSEKASFQVNLRLEDPLPEGAFDKELTLHGVSFRITSLNSRQENSVTLTPSGLSRDNSPQTRPVSGLVSGAEIGDLNADGAPEIYIYVKKEKGIDLIAFGSNRNRSLSEISLPDIEQNPKAAAGYQGGDEFAVMEGILARRFPLSLSEKPGVTMRQLQYKLRQGEAGWKLVLDKIVEF